MINYSRRVVRAPVRPFISPSVPNLCPAHNFIIWSRILKLFHRNDHHIETTCRVQNLGCYLEGQGHSMTLQQNHFQPITQLFEVRFENISQKWSPYWVDMSCALFGLLPWRPRSQHDLAAISCPAYNFVIWSRILQLFLTNYFSVSNTYLGSITRFNRLLFYSVKALKFANKLIKTRSVLFLFDFN